MKKIFEIVGLFSLLLFSFYYTNKMVNVQNNKDPIMVSIKNYAAENNSVCSEGYLTEKGVVLGASGMTVNTALSYSAMKGVGYSEELMVFEEEECILTKENNLNKYIIKGNEKLNAVSIIIVLNDAENIKEIISIFEANNIKSSIATTGEELENNKKYLSNLFNNGYDILYSGTNEKDFKKFIEILNSFNNKYNTFCLYNDNYNVIDFCSKNHTNSIKTSYIFNNSLYLNIKKTLEKGNIIIFKENKNVVDELNIIIKFLKAKGMKILKTTEHIK